MQLDFTGQKTRPIEFGKNKEEHMTRIGYARVSSTDQNLDRQLEQMQDCEKVFQEAVSGASKERSQLQALLQYIREGDIVTVTELERLGRNNQDLTEIMATIQAKGATLEVLNLPTLRGIEDDNLRRLLNNLILEIYKYQAQAEREKIKERQRQGIEIAKAEGKYQGRKALYTENDERLQHAFSLYNQGYTDRDVSKLTGIPERSFRRYRNKYNISRSID